MNKVVANLVNKKKKTKTNSIVIVTEIKVSPIKTIILVQHIKTKVIDSITTF